MDDQFGGMRVDGSDPREVLAAITCVYGEVPTRRIVMLGVDPTGEWARGAAVPMEAYDDATAMRAAYEVLASFASAGIAGIILAVAGDIDVSVSPAAWPAFDRGLRWQSPHLRSIAENLSRSPIVISHDMSFHAYVYGAEHCHLADLSAHAPRRWKRTHVGPLIDSVFFAREVSLGRSVPINSSSHVIDARVREHCAERWAPSHPLVRAPHQGPWEMSLLIDKLVHSGLVHWQRWAHPGTGHIMALCERIEEFLSAAATQGLRDDFFTSLHNYSQARERSLDAIMDDLLHNEHASPASSLLPGQPLFALTRLPVVLLRCMRGIELTPWIEEALCHHSALYALTSWHQARMGHARMTAYDILNRRPGHEMAQYVTRMLDAGIAPPWVSKHELTARRHR